MRFGFVMPAGDAPTAAAFGRDAEAAGWDGFFVWDAPWGLDPWVTLAAVAMGTDRIRLGTMLTPVSRRRPWKLASETATLDNLSGGRVILAVGLGALDSGFEAFGEATDRRTRAELLDEGLDVVTGLWAGQPFAYSGKHYRISPVDFPGPPPLVQSPRIPVWVAGAWPDRPRSMDRALRWDGLLPNVAQPGGGFGPPTAGDISAMAVHVRERRPAGEPFDIVVEGETPGDDPTACRAIVAPMAEAGATWWLEARWSAPHLDSVHRRILQGPPRLPTA